MKNKNKHQSIKTENDSFESRLNRKLKKTFPDRQPPYPPKEVDAIARFLGTEKKVNVPLLCCELKQLAYEILCALRDRKDIKPSAIRKEIDRSIVKPIDSLIRGLRLVDKIGAEEAFALGRDNDAYVDIKRFARDLTKLRAWSEQAKAKTNEPSVPKGITDIRQLFVNRLFEIYHTYSGKIPGRSPQKDQNGNWFEDSEFSRFIDLCAEPIFPQKYNFTRQIRQAQETHQEWLTAGQKPPKKRRGSVHDIESKIKPS
jgi:hypothetical protein